jgi:dTDP-4-amino-4,6-dideoxygalactose transaminase
MEVPFLNLKAHHDSLRKQFSAAIDEVIDASAFAGGPFVTRFEEEFAEFCGVNYAVGVGSGTDALWLAMLAHGIGPGDEVITVPMTFIATAEAISRTGATPVFVDINEATYTLDPIGLDRALTSRTKAILPVHLFGQMADMKPILEFADRHGLVVIEDAAQAHGAIYWGRPEIANQMRMFRDHGQSRKYHHSVVGWNCRMDGIQAAILSLKLRDLDANNAKRRDIAALYSKAFASIPDLIVPFNDLNGIPVHHLYVIRVLDRDAMMKSLAEIGIGTAIHYPIPVHLQKAYAHLGLGLGAFPVSERCANQFVSLPMYPELTHVQISAVAAAVIETLDAALPA